MALMERTRTKRAKKKNAMEDAERAKKNVVDQEVEEILKNNASEAEIVEG